MIKHIKSVLIADDEPLAQRTLKSLLEQAGWRGQITTVQDGIKAVEVANSYRPDLLFLDIRMPGASGIEVLRQLTYQPYVIFTTAYEEHAVTAFELGAVDYLLKPFGRERFDKVLARIEKFSRNGEALQRAIESLKSGKTPSRLFVRDGAKIVPVPVRDLERAEGADDYVALFTSRKQYLVNLRLSQLEKHLEGRSFLRIHRSHLINLEHIMAIEPYDALRLQVVMSSGTRIVASREGSKLLRELPL